MVYLKFQGWEVYGLMYRFAEDDRSTFFCLLGFVRAFGYTSMTMLSPKKGWRSATELSYHCRFFMLTIPPFMNRGEAHPNSADNVRKLVHSCILCRGGKICPTFVDIWWHLHEVACLNVDRHEMYWIRETWYHLHPSVKMIPISQFHHKIIQNRSVYCLLIGVGFPKPDEI